MRFLVIEDESSIRETICKKINREFPDSQIIQKKDIITCPLEILSFQPDVIITDYNFRHHNASIIFEVLKKCECDVFFYTSQKKQVLKDWGKQVGKIPEHIKIYAKPTGLNYILKKIQLKLLSI